jgi:hypothetical protein
MKVQRADLALGVGAIVLAAGYLWLASGIPESLLSDSVGAAGLPRAVGWTLGAVGALLCGRSVLRGTDAPPTQWNWRPHLRALGLLGILFAYVLLAPWLGYAVATGLLLAAGAAYAGARGARNLVLVPALATLLFWLLFVHAFDIPMPGSVLLGG